MILSRAHPAGATPLSRSAARKDLPGKTPHWANPTIQNFNHNVALLRVDITVAYRSHGSGPTCNGVNFLANVAPHGARLPTCALRRNRLCRVRERAGEQNNLWPWPGLGGTKLNAESVRAAASSSPVVERERLQSNHDDRRWAYAITMTVFVFVFVLLQKTSMQPKCAKGAGRFRLVSEERAKAGRSSQLRRKLPPVAVCNGNASPRLLPVDAFRYRRWSLRSCVPCMR